MNENDEKPKGFKVDDRRRFSAEGDVKPEHGDQPQSARRDEPKAASAAGAGGAPHRLAGGQAEAPPEMNFATFIISLSTQALVNLGEIADPAASQAVRDLAAAQQVIDILGLLQQKTRGNLDREESALLESILFDLRMKYVEIVRQQARQAG